jgi:hypothetical protein
MTGLFGHYTRYAIGAGGLLHIRKIIVVGPAALEGAAAPLSDSYIEQWTPLRKGPIDAVALTVCPETLQPQHWYNADNLRMYPELDVETLRGYGIWFKAQGEGAAVGYVLGKKHPVNPEGKRMGSLVLNSMPFDTGMCLLQGIHAPPLEPGAVLDWQLRLLPVAEGLTHALVGRLEELGEGLPPPVVYPPEATFGDELVGRVVAELRGEMGRDDGARVENLRPLVES